MSRLSIQPDGNLVLNECPEAQAEFRQRQNSLAVHCVRCGGSWQYLVLEPTTDANKYVAQLRCPNCHLLVVGALVRETDYIHLSVFSGAAVACP